jgi:deoxyadenosine/deoxycytidine kinase
MSIIVSVEGNIGSGKSTILSLLKKKYVNKDNIIFLQEPVDEWESIKDKNNMTMLQKFYENQEKYSFAFQMMAYISRLALLKDTIKQHPNSIIITERCLNTDRYVFAKMLYDNGKLEDVEYEIYLKWFNHFSELQKIQKVIYLKTDPEICYSRVNKRSRIGESNISIEYLKECHKYHEDMINIINHEVLVIDSNKDINVDFSDLEDTIQNNWLIDINNFIY